MQRVLNQQPVLSPLNHRYFKYKRKVEMAKEGAKKGETSLNP